MSFSPNIVYDFQQMFRYQFMQHAFEAGTIIAVVAGLISYLVVIRRSSFAAHALGHIGFAGAAGAVLVGWAPVIGLLLFTTTSGTGFALLGKKASHRDVEIGSILAFMLGLGVLFISLYRGYATEAYSILFGQILGISLESVFITLGVGIVILVSTLFVYRPILFASLDEDVAEAKGMNTLLLGVVFMLLLAAATSIAVQVIGVLLIFALMVTPAAAAVRLSKKPVWAVTISILVALFGTWTGLFVSFYEPYPVSFFIVSIVFVFYLLVRFVFKRGRPARNAAAKVATKS